MADFSKNSSSFGAGLSESQSTDWERSLTPGTIRDKIKETVGSTCATVTKLNLYLDVSVQASNAISTNTLTIYVAFADAKGQANGGSKSVQVKTFTLSIEKSQKRTQQSIDIKKYFKTTNDYGVTSEAGGYDYLFIYFDVPFGSAVSKTFIIHDWYLQMEWNDSHDISTFANPSNGGSVEINNSGKSSGTYKHFVNLTLNAKPNTGWHFTNWADATSNTSTSRGVTVTGAASYTANFSPNTYTITFNGNNGTLPSGLSTLSPTYTSSNYCSWENLSKTSRRGYTLTGYYDAPNGGNKIYNANGTAYAGGIYWDSNSNWKYAGNVTAYAQWSANKIKLTLDPSPGSGGTKNIWYYYNSEPDHFYSDESCKTEIFDIIKPIRTGYTFVHYEGNGTSGGIEHEKYIAYIDGNGIYRPFASDLDIDIYKDAIFTASWSNNSYYVKFNSNGGEGEMSDQKFTYNDDPTVSAVTLSANTFKRTGYSYIRWNTKYDNSGTPYEDKVAVKNLVAENNGSITLYAIWRMHKYNIRFDANGGTGTTPEMKDISYEASVQLNKNEFSKIGYSFSHWSTSPNNSNRFEDQQWIDHLTSVDNETITLYAIWTQNTYTIKWENTNGDGSYYEVQVGGGYNPGEGNFNIPTPTKAYNDNYHYNFSHWQPALSIVGENITYKAIFKEVIHNYTDIKINPKDNYIGYDDHTCHDPDCGRNYKDNYKWGILFLNGDSDGETQYIEVSPGTLPIYPSYAKTPTKTSTNTIVFTFDENNPWTPPISITPQGEPGIPNDIGNMIYTPNFIESDRYYSIIFKNEDGSIREQQILLYNAEIIPPEPLDIDNDEYDYTFFGWQREDNISEYWETGTIVYEDVIYIATYTKERKNYNIEWWREEHDLEPICTTIVPYGSSPEFPFNDYGIPQKESTHDTDYFFIGWTNASDLDPNDQWVDDPDLSGDLPAVIWHTKYIAQYTPDSRRYKIRWMNVGAEQPYYEQNILFGEMPKFNIEKYGTPVHPLQGIDKVYNYIFIGWITSVNDSPTDNESLEFEGEVTYTAAYAKEYINYEISINRFSGDEYGQPEIYIRRYGEKLYPNAMLKDVKGYTFKYWEKILENGESEIISYNREAKIEVTGNAAYWARYEKIKYKVKWLDYNRMILEDGGPLEFEYKTNPLLSEDKPKNPTRKRDNNYHYVFNRWAIWSGLVTEKGEILGDVTYFAIYDEIPHVWEPTQYEFSQNKEYCTASRYCSINDEHHSQHKTIKTTPKILPGDEPTCTEMGTTTYFADFRDDWNVTYPSKSEKIINIPANGHVIAPAQMMGKHEEKGKHYLFCKNCDYSRIEEHNWDIGEPTKASACVTGGAIKHKCQTFGCQATYYRYVSPNGHNFVTIDALEPTCTENGYIKHKRCVVCKRFFDENDGIYAAGNSRLLPPILIEKLGHSYQTKEVRKKADCVNEGEQVQKCSRCDSLIKTIIKPRKHKWTLQSSTATCAQEGKNFYYCLNANEEAETKYYKVCDIKTKEEYAPKLPHTPVIEKGELPTCITNGLSDWSYCGICKEILKPQYIIPALGHHYVAKSVVPQENTLRREIVYGCTRKNCNHKYHINFVK